MSDAPVEERLRGLVARHLGVAPERLTDRVLLGEELALDSLAAVELAMVVEDEFGVRLEEQELARAHTYGELEHLVVGGTNQEAT